jgi:hypothetical protein
MSQGGQLSAVATRLAFEPGRMAASPAVALGFKLGYFLEQLHDAVKADARPEQGSMVVSGSHSHILH